ncbi:hypothetical protein L6452_19869 [Arctium lappa]|uniref:Uncharacterized protein n=1 Tax=Arctium lappa TaxID=4217 RepID=A0ACB9BBM8_ARCLA|nr:hypothetical protein L6452_19869 [Arctium lappa]
MLVDGGSPSGRGVMGSGAGEEVVHLIRALGGEEAFWNWDKQRKKKKGFRREGRREKASDDHGNGRIMTTHVIWKWNCG